VTRIDPPVPATGRLVGGLALTVYKGIRARPKVMLPDKIQFSPKKLDTSEEAGIV
jgi:hypothetical protein